jgi:hypothetical protein
MAVSGEGELMSLRVIELEEGPRTPSPVYSIACVRWLDAGLALLPAAIARVRKFSAAYGTDDPGGEELVKAILLQASADEPMVVVALFLRGRKIVGHYVVSVDTWMTSRLLTILQFELDESIPIERVRAEIRELERFAKRRGCSGLQALTVNETLARAFRTFYDFKYHATVLRRAFAAEGDAATTTTDSPAEN